MNIELLIPILTAIGGGGILGYMLKFQTDSRAQKIDAFEKITARLEGDNSRLRDDNSLLQIQLDTLRGRVDTLQVQLSLMESAHHDLPIPQWLKATDGTMLSINKHYTSVFGKTPEEYIGKKDFDVWKKPIAQKFVEDDAEVMRSQKNCHFIETIIMPNGALEDWEILKYPRYAGQTLIGIGGIAIRAINTEPKIIESD